MKYFAGIGHPCPSNKNPADFFMSLLSEDTYKQNAKTDTTYAQFIEDMGKKYLESPGCKKVECDPSMPELTDEFVRKRKYKASWFEQFITLYKRACLHNARLFGDEIFQIFAIILFSLFMLALYYDVPHPFFFSRQKKQKNDRHQIMDMRRFRIV